MSTLAKIQQTLKAPKNQVNKFGGYRYRSCEDILEAVKPLLGESLIMVQDELVQIGDRYYIKATATFKSKDENYSVSAYAREPVIRRGMDESQITGATSSYARKYALNGLLLIDDTRDPDATNDHGKGRPSQEVQEISVLQKLRRLVQLYLKNGKDQNRMDMLHSKLEINNLKEIANKDENTLKIMCEKVEMLLIAPV